MRGDYCKYLLRTDAQLEMFKIRYASYIADESSAYLSWLSAFPLMVWTRYLDGVPEKNIPVVIGMLCVLYRSGQVCLSFHDSMLMIRREPADEGEWDAWVDSARRLVVPRKK